MIEDWVVNKLYEAGDIVKFMSKAYIAQVENMNVLPIPVIIKSNALGSVNNTPQVEAIRDLQLDIAREKGIEVQILRLNDNETWIMSQ